MRKSTLGAGLVALASVGALVLGGGTAFAAPPTGTLGTLTLTPTTGADTTAPHVVTSAGCPADADGFNVYVTGPGAWAGGFAATITTDAGLSHDGSFTAFFGLSMKDIAVDNATTITPGEYDVTLNCVDQFSGDVKGTFTTAMTFTSATAYTTTTVTPPTSTSTTLAVAPAGPVSQGTTVTLTATLNPVAATGSVQFLDGANPVGGPVAVAAGSAVLTTAALVAGSHPLTAVYTPSGAFTGSTSAASTLVVTSPVATATTTALSVNPSGSAAQFSPVSLQATITPATAAGAVQFLDGSTALGGPVAVSGGTATLATSSLAVGNHSLSAKFVPSDAAAFVVSQSDTVPLAVTAFAGVSAAENISTTVTAGALVISVDNANVTLPSPQLSQDASKLTTAGALNPITVTDTRAGNVGWNVAGQVTDFSDGATHAINGANLGWTPTVVDQLPVQHVTAGAPVPAGNALAPGAGAPAGTGLGASRTLATAAASGGVGTAHLGASLSLNVPTSTVAGSYAATLTLTAI